MTGGGQTHEIGYLGMRLPLPLPNLLLESRAESAAVGSLLPVTFAARHPTDYQRLFRIVDTVGAKLSRRAARYTDDHSGVRHTVEGRGRRLRTRTSFVSLAVTLVLCAALIAVRVIGAFGS